jgi:hypothetical protein
MLPSERPKPSQGKRRRIFEGRELEQTIRAAGEPYRTLFTVAALTGARLSELLALTWADARLDDLEDAELEFGYQCQGRSKSGPPAPVQKWTTLVEDLILLGGDSPDRPSSRRPSP